MNLSLLGRSEQWLGFCEQGNKVSEFFLYRMGHEKVAPPQGGPRESINTVAKDTCKTEGGLLFRVPFCIKNRDIITLFTKTQPLFTPS